MLLWTVGAALAVPLSGRADCDALEVISASPLSGYELVLAAAACRRVSPRYPPPDATGPAAVALDLGFEVLAAGDRSGAIAIGTAVYQYGAALSHASLGEAEAGLDLQEQSLGLVEAAEPAPTELAALDEVWRFEAGPSASLVGEASLVRQMLAVEVLPRRDRRACEAYAEWVERLGRMNLGLPHDAQLSAITRGFAEDAPEPRSCANGVAAMWLSQAALASSVRARVVALTRPAVLPPPLPN